MKKTITFLLIFSLLHHFAFSQTEEKLDIEKDSSEVNNNVESKEEKIFKIVEASPIFPGCKDQGKTREEFAECAKVKVQKLINENLKYPEVAKKHKIEGRVIARCIIEEDGSLGKIEILRDIGGGCGKEAARLMQLIRELGKWDWDKQKRYSQKLYFTVPIEFKLDTLSLEEKLEQYYYEEMEADFLDTFPKVKKVEEEPEEEKIFNVVEELPHFPGCSGQGLSKEELKKCAEKKMKEFIYSNLKYPPKAVQEKIEGEVIIKFIVDKDGSISNVEILKDIGNGCGEEAKRVIQLMNNGKKWVPTSARGKPVKVRFTVPVIFKLDSIPEQKN